MSRALFKMEVVSVLEIALKRTQHLARSLNRLSGILASVTFGAMSILVILQVMSRSFFGYSFQWAEEMARYFFIWSTMLASACAVYFGLHVGVDLVVARLNVKSKKLVRIVAQLMLIFSIVVLLVYGAEQTYITAQSGQTATSFPVSAAVLYLSVPVSASLMLLYSLVQLTELVFYGKFLAVEATVDNQELVS